MMPIGYVYPLCDVCGCRKNHHSRVETKEGYTCFKCKTCVAPLGNRKLTPITHKQFWNHPEEQHIRILNEKFVSLGRI